ncbi:hypothetical protein [Paraburkholderia bannensis]|uniref:hypothetical protein n=1 Tax=Paraburkholderia bannensis TaxID=765414 RepID=UPI002ABDD185|nr:hypothetical protein [Paraburkholderia bannensis]
MSNLVASRPWLFQRFFKRDRVEVASERPDTHDQVERAALYASHGYFHSSFTPLLFPFVPEIPLD